MGECLVIGLSVYKLFSVSPVSVCFSCCACSLRALTAGLQRVCGCEVDVRRFASVHRHLQLLTQWCLLLLPAVAETGSPLHGTECPAHSLQLCTMQILIILVYWAGTYSITNHLPHQQWLTNNWFLHQEECLTLRKVPDLRNISNTIIKCDWVDLIKPKWHWNKMTTVIR